MDVCWGKLQLRAVLKRYHNPVHSLCMIEWTFAKECYILEQSCKHIIFDSAVFLSLIIRSCPCAGRKLLAWQFNFGVCIKCILLLIENTPISLPTIVEKYCMERILVQTWLHLYHPLKLRPFLKNLLQWKSASSQGFSQHNCGQNKPKQYRNVLTSCFACSLC